MQYLKYIGALTLLIVSAIGCDTTSVHRFPLSLAPKETSKLMANIEPVPKKKDSIIVHVGTFLGNEKRNYSGNYQFDSLHEIWKTPLGSGISIVNSKIGKKLWRGAGWTGQPLLIEDKKELYLIQGSFDHGLKKIRARDGKVIWNYLYDDILKGTGTIYRNDTAKDPNHRTLILQGSRLGNDKRLSSKQVWSYRAISFNTGKEVWRMNVERGKSYSRDVDASAVVVNDTAYLGLESGSFIVFSPIDRQDSVIDKTTYQLPRVYSKHKLYDDIDIKRHRANVVTEASPCRIGNHIYVASGSGHVYGYNMLTQQMDWDFRIGSDLDGTTIVTEDSCLLVTVEKQYIKGKGGVFKLDPSKPDTACVEWFFPTGNKDYAMWKGGIIGSPAINDRHKASFDSHSFAAFTGIDGYLYIVDPKSADTNLVDGPNNKNKYSKPKLIQKEYIGPSISTPVFTRGRLMAAGYKGVYIFKYTAGKFVKTGFKKGNFESTPSVHNGKVFVASRDGYLYCLGKKDSVAAKISSPDLLASMDIHIEMEPQKVEAKEVTKDQLSQNQAVITPVEVQENKNDLTEVIVSVRDEEKEATVSSPDSFTSYIIIGSFRSRKNAENQLDEASKKGYTDIEIFPASENGLFRVAIKRVYRASQAVSQLNNIRQIYASAWLMI
jgi:outer membrane protein assembly factor BamB